MTSQGSDQPIGPSVDTEESTSPRITRANGVQRVSRVVCLDCGQLVARGKKARGPLALRCPSCTSVRRPLAQLRAYLRSAERLARTLALDEVATAASSAVAALDARQALAAGVAASQAANEAPEDKP